MKLGTHAIIVFAAAVLVGCASAPPPTAKLASSTAAIRAAAELQANEIPEAQRHLKYAEDQAATARRLMAEGENERASWLLARSEADAEVAIALAKESQIQRQAAKAQSEVNALPKAPLPGTP